MINMKFKHQINLSNDPKFIKVPKQVVNYIKLKQNNKKNSNLESNLLTN